MKKLVVVLAVFLVPGLFACEPLGTDAASVAPGGTAGKGGSMARFTISGNYLYTVDHAGLNLFDIHQPAAPEKKKAIPLAFGVETIFPYQDKLFIGTQNGMQIFSIQNPQEPRLLSQYEHVVSCDPVVTDGRYAYITLSTGTACARAINQLQIVDLQDISKPTLLTQYPMQNPKGLGIDGKNLFVCDKGLKLYDATDVTNLQLLQHFPIEAYDVIPDNGRLLVVGSGGFYQYQYQADSLELLSKIEVQPAL